MEDVIVSPLARADRVQQEDSRDPAQTPEDLRKREDVGGRSVWG